MTNTYLAIDIETVKDDSIDLYFEMGLAKVDGRLKDPRKIMEAIEKEKTKCALKWWLGKVCMISTELIYENPIHREKPQPENTFYNADELTVLHEFAHWCSLLENDLQIVNLIAKNGKGFDFPFLVGRYLKHNIGVPNMLRSKRVLRDVDEMFSQWGRPDQVTTLSNYAWGLGIEGKTDSNGGVNVQDWYNSGSWDTMKTYCRRDKDIIIEMIRRYRPYELH